MPRIDTTGTVSGAGGELARLDCSECHRVRVFVTAAAAGSAIVQIRAAGGTVDHSTLTLAAGVAQSVYIEGPAGIVTVEITPTVPAMVVCTVSILGV
jgi:hypothetical protein